MTFQEEFTRASRIYLELQQSLIDMMKHTNMNITKREVLNSFDLLIQDIMLNLATVDGIISKRELAFIEKVTIEKDILTLINEKLNKNYSWEILENGISKEDFSKMLEEVSHILDKELNSFISFIASIDATTEKNYGYELTQGMKELFSCFMDSNNEEGFYNMLQNIFKVEFVDKYKNFKDLYSINLNFKL